MTDVNYQIRFLISLSLVVLFHTDQSISLLPEVDDDQAWEAWKAKYGKKYVSSEKEASGRQLWIRKVEAVTQHNKVFNEELESYSQADYDWVDQDTRTRRANVNHLSLVNWAVGGGLNNDSQFVISTLVPNRVDYRAMGYVTSVDDQKECNACWALSIVASMEAAVKRATDRLEKLSAQQIIDCNPEGDGCAYGSVFDALRYVKNYGLQTECDYPFVAAEQCCRFDRDKVKVRLKSLIGFVELNEIQLKASIARYGPAITHIAAPVGSFDDYRGGIYSTSRCHPRPDHSVLIVGYDTSEDGRDYWLIKNSYGTNWGERGYMRLQRNVNMCSIGAFTVWTGV